MLVSLSISLSSIWVSVSISDIGGLAWIEFWTLSHSKEFAEETLDQSESLFNTGAVFWGLDSLGHWEKSSGSAVLNKIKIRFFSIKKIYNKNFTYQELPEGSWIIEIGIVSCSHSKSKELIGVDAAVLDNRARASKHWSWISLLVHDLVIKKIKKNNKK